MAAPTQELLQADALLGQAEPPVQSDRHSKLKDWYEASEESTRNARVKAERDQDYYDGKQLTEDEYQKLIDRGQPPTVINLIRRKIDFLRGMEIKQRTDPKAWPRTPMDADSAEIATDTLRYVFDAAHYNQTTRKRIWKDILVVGWGGLQIQLKSAGRPDPIAAQFGMEPNQRIILKRTPWDRMFWDPHSADHDFADGRYRGLVLWMDEDDAMRLAQSEEAKGFIQSTIDSSKTSESYDDKPKTMWADGRRKRVRIVQIWWKEDGKVLWAEFTQAGILSEGESPFVNEEGDPCDPFIWQSCYVDRDNNRHGIVRDMIDPQDEINKRRSKSLHLLTMRQVVYETGAVQDLEKAKKQLARPDGWIEKAPGLELEIVQNQDLSAGQMRLLEHATMELEKMGPNEALQGEGSATSGRDRQAQQQGGLIELGPTMDDLAWVDLRAYNLTWSTIQRHWTAPQFIRVTDRDDAPQFIGLNEPMMMNPQMPVIDQNGAPVMQNKPAEINVDFIIEPAPDIANLEQEVFEMVADKIPLIAQLPPNWQMAFVEMLPVPASRKRKLTELVQQSMQVDPATQQMQQQGMALEAGKLEAEIVDTHAAADLKHAQAFKAVQDALKPPPQPRLPGQSNGNGMQRPA